MREKLTKLASHTQQQTKSAIDYIESTTVQAQTTVDRYLSPTRQSILKRFPILFSLLVTFGVATTFLGFEKIVSHVAFLDQHPFLLLILGISILAATGTLYKKLK